MLSIVIQRSTQMGVVRSPRGSCRTTMTWETCSLYLVSVIWRNQTRNHWWKIKLQQRLFIGCAGTYNVYISHLYIKEWRL